MTRAGFVGLAGRPNVGKSTLANAVVGSKIAIVSDRPQTTRRAVRGIATDPGREWQLVLVDLPGVQRPARHAHRAHAASGRAGVGGRRLALLVVDGQQGVGTAQTTWVSSAAASSALAMKRSPGPTPCWPSTTSSAESASANSCSTRRCMRAVSVSRGRCTPGRSTRTSCHSRPGSVAIPRTARLLLWDDRDDRDLQARRPRSPASTCPRWAGRRGRRIPRVSSVLELAHDGRLQLQHLAVVPLVVEAAEVQDAVDRRLGEVGACARGRSRRRPARAARRSGPSRRSGTRARRSARRDRGARG